MPNIREASTPQLGLQPTELGIDARTQAARRIGGFYDQKAQAIDTTGQRLAGDFKTAGALVEQRQAQDEVSKFAAHSSATLLSLDDNWNLTVQGGSDENGQMVPPVDPNQIDSIRKKWLAETVEPALAKLQEGVSTPRGQAFAQQTVDRFRDHLSNQSAADAASLAKQAVTENHVGMVNNLSTMVYASGTMGALNTAADTLRLGQTNLINTSNVEGAKRVELNNDLDQKGMTTLVRSAIAGTIAKGGDYQKIINDPRYGKYVNEAEVEQFVREQRGEQRLARADANNQRVMRDYTDKGNFHREMNELELSTMPKQPGGPPTLPDDYYDKIKQIAHGNPNGAALDPGRVRAMVENGERITARLDKPEPLDRTSHATTMDLLDRIRAPVGDPRRLDSNDAIYKEFGDGHLNRADFAFTIKEFDTARTPDGERLGARIKDLLAAVKPKMDHSNPLMGKIDQNGPTNVYRWHDQLMHDMETARKRGKDPWDLLNPSNPDWAGSDKYLQPFVKPLDESLGDSVRALSGAAPVPAKAAERAEGVKPDTVRQNGHTFQRQRDGSYKAID
jgi:hypothetical protein